MAALAVPAFYLLAKPILNSQAQAALATFAFAMLPRSFEWLIMGGGVTRAPGYVFAILALAAGVRLYQRPRPSLAALTGALAGLTALSHPEMNLFVVYSLSLIFLASGSRRAGLAASGLALAVAAAVAAPWWVHALRVHGPEPLLAAFGSGHRVWFTLGTVLMFDLSFEAFLSLIGVAALLGLLACIVERKRLLPVWILVIAILSPRSAGTLAAIPLAMLAAIGLEGVIIPGVRLLSAAGSSASEVLGEAGSWALRLVQPLPVRGLLIVFGLYALLGAYLYPFVGSTAVSSLPPDERAAMAWIAANTPETSRFLVVSGLQNVWQDQSSEWLPALSGRVSLGTVQGYEWLPGRFYQQWQHYSGLQACGMQTIDCLEDWANTNQLDFSHIYLPKRLWWDSATSNTPLRVSLEQAAGYQPVYENEAVVIYVRDERVGAAGRPGGQSRLGAAR